MSASRFSAVAMSSPWPTFGRRAPTDRRASVRCVRARSTAVSTLDATAAGSDAAALALRRLQLHQDRGEPLRQVVVNVARQAVALFEHRLAALFAAIEIDQPAVVQRERGLTRDRLDERDAPPLALGL